MLPSPIVFLHGFLGSPEEFTPLFSELNNEGATAITLPGHGKASLPEGGILPSLIEELKPHLKQKPILIGYSMGGRIALVLREKYPDEIAACILLSAHPGLETFEEKCSRFASDQTWCTLLHEKGVKTFINSWNTQPLFSQTSSRKIPDIKIETIHRYLTELSPAVMPSFWYSSPVPTYFLFGAEDEKYRKIHNRIQKMPGKLHSQLIEKAKHRIHLDNPKRSAHAIRNIIQNLSVDKVG